MAQESLFDEVRRDPLLEQLEVAVAGSAAPGGVLRADVVAVVEAALRAARRPGATADDVAEAVRGAVGGALEQAEAVVAAAEGRLRRGGR